MKSSFLTLAFLSSTLFISCEGGSQKAAQEMVVEVEAEADAETQTEEVEETTETSFEVINANLATKEDLFALGLSQELVEKIIEERPFTEIKTFDALISDSASKEEVYSKVFIPLNLNTTAEEDFKLIPGVGDRMAHEFEEYRPYQSIKQFRREIGKYVDEEEVERYENYVFVPIELNTATEEEILSLPGVGNRMAHEFEEYRPYQNMEQFRREIGKYVDDKELKRLERLVYLKK